MIVDCIAETQHSKINLVPSLTSPESTFTLPFSTKMILLIIALDKGLLLKPVIARIQSCNKTYPHKQKWPDRIIPQLYLDALYVVVAGLPLENERQFLQIIL